MLFLDILGKSFHSEDLDIETLAVGKSILDVGESFFVDLVHMHGETCA